MNSLRKIQRIGAPGGDLGQPKRVGERQLFAGGTVAGCFAVDRPDRCANCPGIPVSPCAGPRRSARGTSRPHSVLRPARKDPRGKIRHVNFDDLSPKVAPAIRARLEQSKEISMKHYEPSIPRVALGIATVAITVITIALSLILPAQMGSSSRELPTLAASKATAPASTGLATVTRVDVVAVREPRSSTVPVRIGAAEPQLERLAKTSSPAVIRVSSEY
jgi:hypothetical protein